MPTLDAVAELVALAEQRHRDPVATLGRALELAAGGRDPRVEATAYRVIGLAQHELGRPADAVASFGSAIRLSVQHGFDDCQALARASMASSLLILGDAAGAIREVTEALAQSPESTRGVVQTLNGLILQRTGRLDDALAAYRRALPRLRAAGDGLWIALLYQYRGVLRGYQGDLDGAIADLRQSEAIATGLDLPILVATATHNLGFVHSRRGALADALAAFDRAERAYATLNNPHRYAAVLPADRAEALILAGLTVEAQAAAAAAVEAIRPTGDLAHLSECRLLLARSHLAAGAFSDAVTEAEAAARQFSRGRRLPWAAQARYVAIQAQILAIEDSGVLPAGLLPRSRRIAAELAAQGWPVAAVHVRTFVGRLALAQNRPAVARAELALAVPARTKGTADLRAQAWHATALLRLAEGNHAGAKRALTRGMTVVDEYRATLFATELRANVAGHGSDLARLGIQLAVSDGDPAEVLRWAERWRAGAIRRPAVRPPDDDELAAGLTTLRDIRSQLRDAALAGTNTRALVQRVAQLEEAVRTQTMQAKGDAAATGRIDVRALRRALGQRVLVEYVAIEGQLHAVTATPARLRLHALGPTADVAQEKQYLLFGLRRLLSARSPADARSTLSSTAARLDELLFAKLNLPPGAPLVVVPTGVLHGIPWCTLPSVAGRPTTIAPSAALWLGDHRRADPDGSAAGGGVVLVAGPGLPGADAEVRELSRCYPNATVLTGDAATATAVLGALERADVAHLAAHGSFRSDSPLFSSLLLADGPLTVYDLERLRAVPNIVVLAACDTASAVVRTGDEPLGTAATLIGLGVRSVVAPVMPVPDGSTVELMVALHRRLLAGDRPSAALANAGVGTDGASVSAFVCMGSNDTDSRHPAADAPAR